MIIIIIISILFSLISTAIMSYISMATGTGPWIEPTLVFLGIIIFRFILSHTGLINNIYHAIGFSTISGALGGIIAVACGWAFPTLYFLDSNLFNIWMSNSYYFAVVLTATVLVSGGFGFIIANKFENYLLNDMQISFPIGELVNKMIFAQDQIKKTLFLLVGALLTIVISIFYSCSKLIPKTLNVIPALSYGLIRIPSICLPIDLLPIFLSIGFVTGHVIAFPLFFGLLSKIFLIAPVHKYFFATITNEGFFLAFVSGIVIQGALTSLIEIPKLIIGVFKQAKTNNLFLFNKNKLFVLLKELWFLPILIIFLYYFKFSLISQIYLLLFTLICTYQVMVIAGKTGLAPFPRFATFVLMPGMVLFKFDAIQITIVSTFVEICCGVAADVLFGRKMAQLSAMDRKKTFLFQLLGLIISALSIGFIFYFLISHFGLGSSELFAQRAYARALLVRNQNFDYIVMILGAIFGFSLRFLKINYLLVIGGLLMPPELAFSLIIGGFLAYIIRNKEDFYPFWSGVFAAGSLWMVIQAIFLTK